MNPDSGTHSFSKSDADALHSLGYLFTGIHSDDFPAFMQNNFPGFDLVKLLNVVEQLIVPYAISEVTRFISVNEYVLQVRLENNFTSEKDALIVSSTGTLMA